MVASEHLTTTLWDLRVSSCNKLEHMNVRLRNFMVIVNINHNEKV